MGHRFPSKNFISTPGPGRYNVNSMKSKQSAVFDCSPRAIFKNIEGPETISYIDIYNNKDPIRPKTSSFTFSKSIEKRNAKSFENSFVPPPGYYSISKYKSKNIGGPIFKKPSTGIRLISDSLRIPWSKADFHSSHWKNLTRNNWHRPLSSGKVVTVNFKSRNKCNLKNRIISCKHEKIRKNRDEVWINEKKEERIKRFNKNNEQFYYLLDSANKAKLRIRYNEFRH